MFQNTCILASKYLTCILAFWSQTTFASLPQKSEFCYTKSFNVVYLLCYIDGQKTSKDTQ
jgi:hypothetical protein